MQLILIIFVALVGIATTLFAAWRFWQLTRQSSPAPSALLAGYLAVMVGASLASIVLLRLISA